MNILRKYFLLHVPASVALPLRIQGKIKYGAWSLIRMFGDHEGRKSRILTRENLERIYQERANTQPEQAENALPKNTQIFP